MSRDPNDKVLIEGTYLDDIVYLLITFIAETGGFFLTVSTLIFAAFVLTNPTITGDRLNMISNLISFSFGGGVGQMNIQGIAKKKDPNAESVSPEAYPPDYYLPPDS